MNSDDRLVELVIGGDDMAFELLYARHVADALAFADGLLGSREEAEQAVRHSFAAAHAYLADGGRKTAFEPWLYTILDNHCLSVLQRRRGGAEPPLDEAAATVVDIDQWRRRRRLIGATVPIAPSAGFHDSVMTACGIGGGAAASAAAPLLGGTLAKVAVVALLAGGAGVAGEAASDRDGPVDVAQAPPAPAVDSGAAGPAAGLVTQLDRRADGPKLRAWSPPRPGGGGAVEPLRAAGEGAGPPTAVPVGQPPEGGAAGPSGDVRIPAGAPTGVGVPTVDVPALPSPDDGSNALRRLGERVKEGLPTLAERLKAGLPALGEPPAAKVPKLPSVVELPEIDLPKGTELPKVKLPRGAEPPADGDDEDVPAAQSSIDVRALLEQGLGAPPA